MNDVLIALAGNPNAGKTTLFNRMTGARERAGNRPGVTVAVRTKRMHGYGALLADLPGVYSLTACSPEEAVAEQYLHKALPDVIIDIVDATKLERNLLLTTQLLELGRPLVVALNMMDEAEKKRIRIDAIRLSDLLGVPVVPISARTGKGVDGLRTACLTHRAAPQPVRFDTPQRRYRFIEGILRQSAFVPPQKSSRADRALAGGWLAVPLFLIIMALVFFLCFDSLGAWLSDGVGLLMAWLQSAVSAGLSCTGAPAWLLSLLCEGVLAGVGGVLRFLPQIALLFFLLSLLEDSGYMARTAFLSDRWLRRFGLSGRAFIPMLLGFGCTVPAALAARTLGSACERRKTVLLLPFVSCSAKLPIYALMTAAFFPSQRGLVMLCIYVGSILCGLLSCKLLGVKKSGDFVIELPPYRLPRPKNTLLYAAERIGHFLSRAGTVILVMSVLLWLLRGYDASLSPVTSPQDGMLAMLGRYAAPLFAPLGFGSWQAAVALLCGLAAKEAVVSTLSVLLGGQALSSLFTPAGACAFLAFTALYSPCAAALAAMGHELGGKGRALLTALCQTALAYAIASLVHLAAGTLLS